ncbi:MAG: hypothetical protein MJY52_02610 [Bacteroidaceae bacterium]|nr:hypothetical protein [Bacteroidaceae bacterium]
MKNSKLFKNKWLIIVAITMVFASCYRIGKIYSPKTVDPNKAYSARILVVNDNNSDPQTGYSMFAVCVPSNWTVSVKEGALKQYGKAGAMIDGKWDVNTQLDMVYSPNYSHVCNEAFPREGYEWVGFRTKNIYRRSLKSENGGCDSIAIDFDVLNNGVAGDYEIDYIVGNIESNDENTDAVEAWTGNPLNSDFFTTATFGIEGTDFKKVNADGHSIVTVKEGGTPTYITPKISISKNSIEAGESIDIAYENLAKNNCVQIYKNNSLVPMACSIIVTDNIDERFYSKVTTIEGLEPGVYHVRPIAADGTPIFEETVFTVGNYAIAEAPLGQVMVMGAPGLMAPEILVNDGIAFQKSALLNANLYSDSPALVDWQLNKVIAAKPQALLVIGDLTKGGDLTSHQLLANKLQTLLNAGINVCVVPGAVDIANPSAAIYDGDNTIPTQNITADQFVSLYANYGFNNAVSRDENTLSYMTYLNSNIALLAIDGCEYKEYGDSLMKSGHINEATFNWIKSACGNAIATGRKIIAISSHIIAAPFNGFATLGNIMNNNDGLNLAAFTGDATGQEIKYTIDNAEVQALLAQCGVSVVFTAGTNATDIQCINIGQDNSFYQVNTGFATAYECPLRTVSFQNGGMYITTDFVKDFTAPDGMTFEEYAYYRTINELPKAVEAAIIDYWPQIQKFLTERFTFEIDETQEIDFLRDKNMLFKLPETGEELANNINSTVIPPLIKVITINAQGNEDKTMGQRVVDEFHAGVNSLFECLVAPDYLFLKDFIVQSVKDGFAEAGLDVDALIDNIVGSIVFNYTGKDKTNVTNDLYTFAPYSNITSNIRGIINTKTASTTTYNMQGQRVSNNYKGIVISNAKKYIVK